MRKCVGLLRSGLSGERCSSEVPRVSMLPFAERPDPEPGNSALVSAGWFGQLRLWSLSTVCVRVVFLRKER